MWHFAISSACILVAGLVGGLANALMSDNGFVLPRSDGVNGQRILRPGVFGNVAMGGIAALISWGLYGPFGAFSILTSSTDLNPREVNVTLSALAGAALIGIGGARWLSDQVDKNLLRAAAVNAAGSAPNPQKARAIALAVPAEAFRVSKDPPTSS